MVGYSELTVLSLVYAVPIPIAITQPVVWIVGLKRRRDPIWSRPLCCLSIFPFAAWHLFGI
jgi:hypothetical protein